MCECKQEIKDLIPHTSYLIPHTSYLIPHTLLFSERSYKKEILDRDDIPFDDIRQNMKELDFINTHLGGHRITIHGVKKLLSMVPPSKRAKLVICEIGCGGGDNLLAIDKWCKKQNIRPAYIGIDINPFCVAIARDKLASLDTTLITSDYKFADFGQQKPDLIFSSLFCHHFNNEDLAFMLSWMKANASVGFFINDLHRHRFAFYAIKLLTSLFSQSYLVKNDAPLSVRRGFKKKEWERLLNSAGIHKYMINWKWAFRHLITVSNNDNETAL